MRYYSKPTSAGMTGAVRFSASERKIIYFNCIHPTSQQRLELYTLRREVVELVAVGLEWPVVILDVISMIIFEHPQGLEQSISLN